jgi:serpin B
VRYSLVAASVASLAITACSSEPPTGPPDPINELPRPLSVAEQQIVQSDNSFTFRLLHETLAREQPDNNVFVSPLSVAMALGMTYNGASGPTAQAFEQTLELAGLTRDEINRSYRGVIDLLRGLDPNVTFTIANSIWYRDSYVFDPAFLETNRVFFDAAVRGLDFSSPAAGPTINAWVNENTGGRIPRIVPEPIPDSIIMYLINAIYFRGYWTSRFDPTRTENAPFFLAGNSSVQVQMMTHGKEVSVRLHRDQDVTVLDLPYGGGAWSMTIVLPSQGRSLTAVTSGLTQAAWGTWIAGLDSTESVVFLPRFTMRYDLAASDVLKALGLASAYCDAPMQPDFTRMDPLGQACISDVKHRTFLLVDESGTEAAAATSVEIGLTSAPLPVRVDRPFLFAIRERLSGAILFIGRIMNPAA